MPCLADDATRCPLSAVAWASVLHDLFDSGMAVSRPPPPTMVGSAYMLVFFSLCVRGTEGYLQEWRVQATEAGLAGHVLFCSFPFSLCYGSPQQPTPPPALPAGFCLQDMAENGDLSWSRTTFFLFWRYGREVLERGAWRPAGTARTAERG